MAIELEYKYILKQDYNYESKLINALENSKIKYTNELFHQIYLKGSGRVRSRQLLNGKSEIKYEFTYKDFISEGSGNIEFNKSISKKDFEQCSMVAKETLNKNRISFKVDGYVWEVDIFKNNDGTSYFNLMEVEVETGYDPSINNLPPIIKHNVILKTLDDSRFTSKKLSNIEYAEKLYDEI